MILVCWLAMIPGLYMPITVFVPVVMALYRMRLLKEPTAYMLINACFLSAAIVAFLMPVFARLRFPARCYPPT